MGKSGVEGKMKKQRYDLNDLVIIGSPADVTAASK